MLKIVNNKRIVSPQLTSRLLNSQEGKTVVIVKKGHAARVV